jgi:hypothetical protein
MRTVSAAPVGQKCAAESYYVKMPAGWNIRVTSFDSEGKPRIVRNFLADEADKETAIELVRKRVPMSEGELAEAVAEVLNDKLAARGELGSAFADLVVSGEINVEPEFRVTHVKETDGRLRVGAESDCCGRRVTVDELIVATGFRSELRFLRELRITLDPVIESPPALAPLIDPNGQSCGAVRPHGARELAQDEPGFYFAGMKSYGRAPTFLMITGYEQVRSIAAEIAGDHEAAQRIELVLPETGVCHRTSAPGAGECCGGPAPSGGKRMLHC